MGVTTSILTTPITNVNSISGKLGSFDYEAGEMQGWRVTMEDAMIAESLDAPEGLAVECSLYGVFDGHGGNECSKFCAVHFAEVLTSLEEYKANDIEKALKRAYHRIDEMLRMPEYASELEGYAQQLEGYMSSPIKRLEAEIARLRGDATFLEEEIKDVRTDLNRLNSGELHTKELTSEEDERLNGRKLFIAQVLKPSNSPNQYPSGSRQAKQANLKRLEELLKECRETIATYEEDLKEELKATETSNNEPFVVTSGCTAVVTLIIGDELYVANAGDSRAVISKRGAANALSQDHKPFLPKERRRIEDAGGYVSKMGRVCDYLNLSRSIGDLKYKQDTDLPVEKQIITADPDIEKVKLSGEIDFLLLACDGVWDVKSNQQAVDFVIKQLRDSEDTAKIIESLFHECISKESPVVSGSFGGDNMTCILVFFHPREKIIKSGRKDSVVSRVYRNIRTTLSRNSNE